MRLITTLFSACNIALLSACSNALYFYGTEKISLTIEARPDPSQPVQGNLGIKQRTALVVPPKRPENSGNQGNEALSSIASFRFVKEPGGVFDLGPVTIRSALVTGEAATALSPEAQQNAARALSGVDIQSYGELAEKAIQRARSNNLLDELSRLVQKPWAEVTAEERKKLGQITGAGETYNEELHRTIHNRF